MTWSWVQQAPSGEKSVTTKSPAAPTEMIQMIQSAGWQIILKGPYCYIFVWGGPDPEKWIWIWVKE